MDICIAAAAVPAVAALIVAGIHLFKKFKNHVINYENLLAEVTKKVENSDNPIALDQGIFDGLKVDAAMMIKLVKVLKNKIGVINLADTAIDVNGDDLVHLFDSNHALKIKLTDAAQAKDAIGHDFKNNPTLHKRQFNTDDKNGLDTIPELIGLDRCHKLKHFHAEDVKSISPQCLNALPDSAAVYCANSSLFRASSQRNGDIDTDQVLQFLQAYPKATVEGLWGKSGGQNHEKSSNPDRRQCIEATQGKAGVRLVTQEAEKEDTSKSTTIKHDFNPFSTDYDPFFMD